MYYLIKRTDLEYGGNYNFLVITKGDRKPDVNKYNQQEVIDIFINTKCNYFKLNAEIGVAHCYFIDEDKDLEKLKERAMLELL